jgi:hypothetical protein
MYSPLLPLKKPKLPRKNTQTRLVLQLLSAGQKVTRIQMSNYGIAQPYGVIHSLRETFGFLVSTENKTDGVGRTYASWSMSYFESNYVKGLLAAAA